MAQSGKEFFEKRYQAIGGKIVDVKLDPCIRINTLKESNVAARLKELGVELSPVKFLKNAYYVKKSPFSVGAITEHLLGYYYIQSAAAQLPAVILDPKPKEDVLDMCSAPGGKLTQMAALMGNKGRLFAYELKKERIVSLITNLERCGVKNCVAFASDASGVRKLKLKFDKILLDAPCSGNYVSDPKWFTHRTLDGIKRSAAIQKRLLRIAVEVLKPGGTLVYSTCSLDPLENEDNINWALDNLPVDVEDTGLKIGDDANKCRRFWPHKTNTEGFFIAKLRKNG
ncbi:RsmB/NOP family class I SAM-dependent RNA methyltransferase [Candidatus Woesearchaeota archaeon]|nr:RsmB/NOP family class I SAM-dependent RNA methyltransferase [Candidatus Woesearchaeota archaeon]